MTEKQKAANTIFYQESTSEIKDDIPALLDCWKGQGLGNKSSYALARTEAGFILWYHALTNPDTLQEMYDNNVVSISILVLDIQSAEIGSVTDTQRTIASNLLRLVVENEDLRDKFLTAKGQSGSGFQVLTDSLSDIAVGQERVAGVLRMLSEGPKQRNRINTSFAPVPWKSYLDVISDERNMNQKAKTELAFFIRYMTIGRDDLKEEAGDAGAVRALLQMLRMVKAETALNAAAGCIFKLSEAEAVLDRVGEGEGIKILADVIGPPPKFYLRAAADEEDRRKAEEKEREEATIAKREELEQMRLSMTKGSEPKKSHHASADHVENVSVESEAPPTGKMKSRKPKGVTKLNTALPTINRKPSSDLSAGLKQTTPSIKGKTEAIPEVFVMPKIDVKYIPVEQRNSPHGIGKSFQPHEVGKTALCIQWSRSIGVQTKGYACGILYNLALKEYHCIVLDSCGIAYRMCQFLKSMIDQPEAAKGGKSSKKDKGKKGKPAKLKLAPEEENAIVAITGCLRHMTMNHDANKARLVKYGAVPLLVQLYEQSTRNKVRWNCRGVLNDVGCLAENGKTLDGMGIFPEEFLVYDPMHLLKSDLVRLQQEFAAEAAKPRAAIR